MATYDPLKPPDLTVKPPSYTATDATAATYNADRQTVGDKSLVANQMTGLLSKTNPYMNQAETQGLQQANKRGLLNSSMAVGAVEGQRIAAALPIAQQDAATFGNQDLTNQQFENTARQFNADTSTRVSQQNAEAKNQAGQFGAATKAEYELAEFGEAGTNYRASLEADMRKYIANMEASVGDKESFLTFANENNQQFMLQVSEIMRSPDIRSDIKTTMINEMQALYKANFDLAAKVADYPVEWVPIKINATETPPPAIENWARPQDNWITDGGA